MTLEANPLSVPVDRDPAWPFLEELDAGQIMTVCAKAAELRRVENKSLPTAIALALINTRLRNFINHPRLDSQLDSHSRRLATFGYHGLLFSIPLTELTISSTSYSLPKHAEDKSNYIDRQDIPIAEKADMFLQLQRYTRLLKEDTTAIRMLETGVMIVFSRSAAKPEGSTLKTLEDHGLVKGVADLQKPEIRCILDPPTLGSLQAYCDYRKVYPVASGQKPPQML